MTTPALAAAVADRYRIERELGRGGMGTVYLAHDLRHGRRVALKVMHAELAAAVGSDRFLQEIRIAAGLSHPNILPLYDSGTWVGANGTSGVYFVMPLVEGTSLRTRLRQERQLPMEDALRIAREVAEALGSAHAQGVIHRDVKPENILLEKFATASGARNEWRVFLTDFGIATAAESAGAERLTESGLAVGTPAYMSPEQASAERRIDHRSDLYSLGCVLYEMLAGQPPFTAATARAILARHVLDPVPSLRSVRPAVPPPLERAVNRALAKVPADRFPSAEAFAEALADDASASPSRAGLAPKRRLLRPAFLGGLALAGLALSGVVLFRRHPASTTELDPGLVVVLPFQVSDADSSLGYLREGMLDLLSAKLTGEGGPRAVDARAVLGRWSRLAVSRDADPDPKQAIGIATGFRAGRLIEGSVVGTADHLILSASVIAVPGGGALTRASVAGPAASLPLLVDRLTSQVLAGEAGRTELAGLTSLPAIRAYLDGKRLLRAGHFADAVKDFDRALGIDSSFGLAALEFEEASGWVLGKLPTEFGGRVVTLAWSVRDRLSPRDRALLVAHAGPRFPLPSSKVELLEAAEQAVAAAPERPEAWYKLGDEYYHRGALLGLPHPLGQAAAAFRRAEELESAAGRSPDAGPLSHELEIAAFEGDTAAVRRYGTLALGNPGTEDPDAVRWMMAVVLADSAALSTARARFNQMSVPSLTSISWQSQETGLAPDDGRRAVTAMLATAKTVSERNWGLAHLYGLALNGGRPAEAQDALRRHGADAEWYDPIGDALFWGGDSRAADSASRKLAAIADGPLARTPEGAAEHRGEICGTELWRLSHGELGKARFAVAELRGAVPRGRSVHDSSRAAAEAKACAALLEAWWASAARRPEARQLVAQLDSLARTSPYGWNPVWNLVLARLLEAQGDSARALAAVKRRVFGLVPRNLATFLHEEGRLAARNGDTAGAIAAYRHYIAIRPDPEPAVRPEVEQVRSELAALVAEPR